MADETGAGVQAVGLEPDGRGAVGRPGPRRTALWAVVAVVGSVSLAKPFTAACALPLLPPEVALLGSAAAGRASCRTGPPLWRSMSTSTSSS